ncbi:MAG: ABC transporter permease [Pseudomonadota bacterium]
MSRYVDRAPFDPGDDDPIPAAQARELAISHWGLMRHRLMRHKLAVVSGVVLLALYLAAAFAEVVAPYGLTARDVGHIYAPPQGVRIWHDGALRAPFVYPLIYSLNRETLKREYDVDRSAPAPIRFFCLGAPYKLWGFIPGRFRLVCPPRDASMFLLGSDRLGRDMLSRIVYGTRISLTVGLVGIAVSFTLALFFGGMAGYFGGRIDSAIQRLIEVMRSLPELPLWMALSAAVPVAWSPMTVYFCITIILGLLDWPGLARAIRAKLLSLREEDYATAAQLMGARPTRIVFRHLMPNFMSHLIAALTLSIPAMILGETALSFLGLGLRPPVTSWGVLLTEAQNIDAVILYPWIMTPMAAVVLAILAFNFFGDGLRDAADPQSHR